MSLEIRMLAQRLAGARQRGCGPYRRRIRSVSMVGEWSDLERQSRQTAGVRVGPFHEVWTLGLDLRPCDGREEPYGC